MPAHYVPLYDVRNLYPSPSRPKRYVWGVYLRTAPSVILATFKRKKDAARRAAVLSGPLKRI